jgi:two-component sensor histidine kinase
MYHDAELRLQSIENAPPSWPPAEDVLRDGDLAVFDPFTAERIIANKREVLDGGQPQRLEVPQRRDGEELLWFELSVEQDRDETGAPRGLFVAVTDITHSKRREATLRDLLFEVSHRSRNMLAILQSILGQTARTAPNVAAFEEKFRGRIASLAQSQDLITYANWQEVRFRRVAETQISQFAEEGLVAHSVEGLDPLLSPNTALHLGLALHELAANSHAYGVLGHGGGSVRVVVESTVSGARFEWIETPNRPMLVQNDRPGFGRTVLQHVVPRALQAEAIYSIHPDGVHYSLDLPQGRFTDNQGATPLPPSVWFHA